MLSKLRRRIEDEKGFTLIELLVVVLIIGILAAIAIPSFINQRGKAQDSVAKSDVKTAQTAMETLFTDNQTYATGTPAALIKIEPTLSGAKNLATTPGPDAYSISVDSSATGTASGGTYKISRDSAGNFTRTCTNSGQGGCKSDGTW